MAMKASTIGMMSTDAGDEGLPHGGDLGLARRLFPGAPEPFIDLSTGINPWPYRLPRFSAGEFAQLPQQQALNTVAAAAAKAYGAPSAENVVIAPGSQILLPLAAGLLPPSRAAVVSPTYPEFARAAALAGHDVKNVESIERCGAANLVIIANPNNPDGRLFARTRLLKLAQDLRRRGGLLVIDEAFMDVVPAGASLAADVAGGNVVVLRSFGKFFGLPGLRLGFALTAPPLARRLAAVLGPWPVSTLALAIAAKALADTSWIERTRKDLAQAATSLDAVLTGAGLEIIGGTDLFRLARSKAASALFGHLGRAGIYARTFNEHPNWLRFGPPPNASARKRLRKALATFGAPA
jgi:cobalamin biosynthesis protein CobC